MSVVDERFLRPVDITETRGDARKAREVLGWEPTVSFDELVAMMVDAEVERARPSARHASSPTSTERGSESRADVLLLKPASSCMQGSRRHGVRLAGAPATSLAAVDATEPSSSTMSRPRPR